METLNIKELPLIGKGLFTKCYKLDNKTVIYDTIDHAKECMAYGWFPDSTVFPTIEWYDDHYLKTEYFPKVSSLKKSLKPNQYAIYKELRGLSVINSNERNLFDDWHKQFDTVSNKRVREALKDALDAMGNYGTDVRFEISPRNVAVKNGMLILLDCFFMSSQAQKVRTSKR